MTKFRFAPQAPRTLSICCAASSSTSKKVKSSFIHKNAGSLCSMYQFSYSLLLTLQKQQRSFICLFPVTTGISASSHLHPFNISLHRYVIQFLHSDQLFVQGLCSGASSQDNSFSKHYYPELPSTSCTNLVTTASVTTTTCRCTPPRTKPTPTAPRALILCAVPDVRSIPQNHSRPPAQQLNNNGLYQ